MPKPIQFLLVVIPLFAFLLAACQPSGQTPIALTPEPPGTLPAYPPPTTPVQVGLATATIPASPTAEALASPETTQPYPAPNDLAAKATPVSDSPAAGVCDLQEGDQVTFEINPDIPSPRCAQALPTQSLHVINRTQADLEVSIASFHATLAPDQDIVFETPLGDYLLPGVHVVLTSAYGGGGGPELWLVQAAPTEAPYPAP